MSMSTEVLICTYNGAAYIETQLRSIMQQSQPVDRITIYDDRSTDRTVAVINEFVQGLEAAVADKIRLTVNSQNLGYAQNFMHAIAQAQEDILFLCDQDDCWEPTKVARFMAAFREREVDMMFSDGTLIDAAGARLGSATVLLSYGLPKPDIVHFNLDPRFFLVRRNFINGAAAAIRRETAQAALPLPCAMPHDYWLAVWASVHRGVFCIADELYQYRQHANNVIGMGSGRRLYVLLGIWRHPLVPRRREARIFAAMADRLAREPDLCERGQIYRDKNDWLQSLLDASAGPATRACRVVKSLFQGHYKRLAAKDAIYRDLVALGKPKTRN